MLNMLLGIGISSLAIIAGQAEQFTLSFSPSLMLSLGVLVTVLTSDLMLVPLLGFRFTRGHGYFLVILYALFTVGNIALELIF
jgi:sodium/potassium/calcium exchanger 6